MAAPLDLDQLKTFVAIAEAGSFTKAADVVFKTQSAVSMQMRKLEGRIGKQLFIRDGRYSRLSEDGERLLVYARRLVSLSTETLAVFDKNRLQGIVRFGMPDDYADRYLPDVLARFSQSNPAVEVEFACEPTPNLREAMKQGKLDLALITHDATKGNAQIVRNEPVLWVTSVHHDIHKQDVVPVAFGRETCVWRRQATALLDSLERPYKIRYTSWSATVIATTVLSGLAVSVLPESALRGGMRVLGEDDGFPPLEDCQVGLIYASNTPTALTQALGDHVVDALDNLSPTQNAGYGMFGQARAQANRTVAAAPQKLRPGHIVAGW